MISRLADLDELILKCRDDRAKAYIAEAVASYRSGAFRSSIVSAWIAVCFDVIEKIRELALSGDKEAEKHADELEKTRKSHDVSKALKFERELLELARDKFELISHIEFIDLDRLQEDRNRCAHPSLITDGQAFSPSAELARVHIRSAVSHLLQHPPVQGKGALDRLLNEVDSEYFPRETNKAKISLSSGPLLKPRESLVRNFVIILLKKILKEDVDWKYRRRIAAALNAVAQLHPHWYDVTIKEKLSPLLRSLNDTEMKRIISLFQEVSDVWQHVENDVCQRIENFVIALPSSLFESLDFLLSFAPLQKQARTRVSQATFTELKDNIFFDLPNEIADRVIQMFLSSQSFDYANERAKLLSIYASDLNGEQIKRIVVNAAKNDQVLYSFELGALLNTLRNRKKITEKEFDDLLNANGLEKYAPSLPQPT